MSEVQLAQVLDQVPGNTNREVMEMHELTRFECASESRLGLRLDALETLLCICVVLFISVCSCVLRFLLSGSLF